jgi:predicted kinase
MLIVFSGAPATGKTTLSRPLAQQLAAVYLRIDTIEHPVMAAYGDDIADTGYRVAYGLARDNLLLGRDVVADCVNPLNITRDAWRDVGLSAGVPVTEIEVLCSDPAEHRRRVETRTPDIPGLAPPTWDQVCCRRIDPWVRAHTVIDTAGRTVEECLAACGMVGTDATSS